MSKTDLHREICERLNKIYTAKNKDYGDSFGEGFQEYGLTMAAIRLDDKLHRFKQLIKQEAEVKDESALRDAPCDAEYNRRISDQRLTAEVLQAGTFLAVVWKRLFTRRTANGCAGDVG